MKRLRWPKYTSRIVPLLTVITLALSAAVSYAAYRIARPVALGDEPINQGYLYGEGTTVHKGVDFSAGVDFGDSVYAVADGQVIQKEEERPDNCHPTDPQRPYCRAWGNYVLIQHDTRHYDRVSGQMAYVYSLYLHLRQNQVFVEEGQDVS